MPKLDRRLRVVAQLIDGGGTHADIGSDHGALLVHLLRSGRIQRAIAIENKRQPLENSRRALAGLHAEVRFGDGLSGLVEGEATSLSICGMGAERTVKILRGKPARLPDRIVLQPHRQPELIRRWARESGFRIVDEQIVRGHWPYAIVAMDRSVDDRDPAYDGLDQETALLFGPLIVRRRDPQWLDQLRAEARYLERFQRLTPQSAHRLRLIRRLL